MRRSGAPDGEASVTLTMRLSPPAGPARTMELKRTWTQLRDGWLNESIDVAVSESGRATKLAGIAAQRAIEDVLPSGRPPLVLTDCEEIDMISHLASVRHHERELAEKTIAAMVGAWPEEMWREVAGPVIKAANHMLLALDGPSEILLLPEQAARRWGGAYPIAPGIWSTDETMGARRLTCIGLALVLGPHLAGEVSAPLVLDAPVNRMEPGVEGRLAGRPGRGGPAAGDPHDPRVPGRVSRADAARPRAVVPARRGDLAL